MTTTYSEPRLRLLVIENEPGHYEQIRAALEPEGYDVVQMETWRPDELYNYKALHGENQIIIVDYDLGEKETSHSGRELVRNELWEVDRMAIFIAFSRHVDKEDPRDPVDLRTVQPYRVLVAKDVDPKNQILAESLEELVEVVNHCREIAIPVLETPRHEVYPMIRELEDYLRRAREPSTEYTEPVKKQIFESQTVLNRLTSSASHYSRAGHRALRLAVGVYGSCGRMEKRHASDVEFSVFYGAVPASRAEEEEEKKAKKEKEKEEEDDRELLKLAVSCWNRMSRFCGSNGLHFEMEERMRADPRWVLRINDPNVQNQLENTYLPVIHVGTLVKADLELNAAVRNRYYQVLTELRPVFNPRLVFRLKQKLLTKDETLPLNLGGIAASDHLRDIFAQFSTDNRPRRLDDWRALKRFTSRFMNLLACRLAVLRELRRESQALDTDARWRSLFESLTDPGIVKVARFANLVRDMQLPARRQRALEKPIGDIMSSYFELLSRYNVLSANTPKQQLDPEVEDLRSLAKQLAGQFIVLLDQIGREEAFKTTLARRREWLVDTTPVEHAIEKF